MVWVVSQALPFACSAAQTTTMTSTIPAAPMTAGLAQAQAQAEAAAKAVARADAAATPVIVTAQWPSRAKGIRQYGFGISLQGGAGLGFRQAAGGELLVVSGGYSELRRRFHAFRTSPHGRAHAFPSKGCFLRDFTTNEDNVKRRTEELRVYLTEILNVPFAQDQGAGLRSAELMEALEASPEVRQRFEVLAAARWSQAEARQAEAAAQYTLMCETNKSNCEHAQNFNQLVAYSNMRAGVYTTVTFPSQMVFHFCASKMWSLQAMQGDNTIHGPGGLSWFQLLRTNPTFFQVGTNAQFMIANMHSEPMMLLEETFQLHSFEYNLFRIDPRTPNAPPIHACRIFRDFSKNMFTITEKYEIDLSPATSHATGQSGRLQRHGNFPAQFVIHNGNGALATINGHLLSLSDACTVTICPNVDCLLFLGIACAIDRITRTCSDEIRVRHSR